MTRRSRDWNKGLARDLKKPRFAREFVRAALEEGLPLQVVLGKVIRLYGVKEFADKVGLPSSNLLRSISLKHNPTFNTINRLLSPLGLELTIAPRGKRKAA